MNKQKDFFLRLEMNWDTKYLSLKVICHEIVELVWFFLLMSAIISIWISMKLNRALKSSDILDLNYVNLIIDIKGKAFTF